MLAFSRPYAEGGISFFPLRLMLLVAVCGRAPLLWAQPADEEALESSEEEVVEIRAPRLDGITEAEAAAQSEIRPDDRAPGARSLPRLLHESPSARLREFGGEGQLATVSLRGGSPAQTLILLDGVPLPSPLGGGMDLSLLPAEFIERIEVLRGAAASRFGGGALGGALNLVTRTPREAYSFKLSGGSFATFQGLAAAGFRSGRTRYLLAGAARSSRGDFPFRDDRGTPFNPADDRERLRQNNDSSAGSWLLRAQSDLGTGGVWAITHLGTFQERGVAGLLGFASRGARERNFLETLDLRAHHAEGPALVTVCARQLAATRRFSDPLGELTGVPVESRQETTGADLDLSARIAAGPHRARLWLSGATLSLRDADLRNPVRRSVSLGAFGKISLGDGALWLEPGLRLLHASDAGSQLSASAGARLRLSRGWWAWVAGGSSARIPEFAELYLRSGFAEGNPDLASERAVSAEAGLSLRRHGLRASLSGYFVRYTDLIVYEPAAAFRYKPQNTGRVDVGGLEAEARLRPLPFLDVQLSYAWLLSRDRTGRANRDGNRVPGWPDHQGTLRVLFSRQPLVVEAAAYWIGENFVNLANTKSLPARLLLDLSAGIRPSPETALMLEVRNVTDRQVEDVRGFPVSGVSFLLTFSCKGGD